MGKRSDQQLSVHLLDVRENFLPEIMPKLTVKGMYYGVQPYMFENLDKTTVLFRTKPNSTVNHTD